MRSVYINLSDDNHAWLTRVSAETGQSMTRIADAVITHARRLGWQITIPAVQVVQPELAPASHRAASGTPATEPPSARPGSRPEERGHA